MLQWKIWRDHVFKRQDPGIAEQIPESFGGFTYFITQNEYPESIKKDLRPGEEV